MRPVPSRRLYRVCMWHDPDNRKDPQINPPDSRLYQLAALAMSRRKNAPHSRAAPDWEPTAVGIMWRAFQGSLLICRTLGTEWP
jgi:hypothetical protein